MEHKVVMLGAQACGKTSLLERYMRGTFNTAEYQCVSHTHSCMRYGLKTNTGHKDWTVGLLLTMTEY